MGGVKKAGSAKSRAAAPRQVLVPRKSADRDIGAGATSDDAWELARTLYTEGAHLANGDITYPSFQEVYHLLNNISPGKFKSRMAAEGWDAIRESNQNAIAQGRARIINERFAKLALDFDCKGLAVAAKIIDAVERRLDLELAVPKDGKFPPLLDAATLKSLAETLRLAHQAGHFAMGDVSGEGTRIGIFVGEAKSGAYTPQQLKTLATEELLALEGIVAKLESANAPGRIVEGHATVTETERA